MPILSTVEEVDAWLAEAGWYPGRDAEKAAAEAVATVIGRYRAYGVDIEPPAAALAFVREHVSLQAVIDTAPENFAVLSGRFFLSHHTGPYYLGGGKCEALMRLTSGQMGDAEGYFT
ncbi:SUKH-3 domain-containing protein [Streptomyces sp. NPDC055886]